MSNPRVGPLFASHEPRRCDYAPCVNGCVIMGGCPDPDPAFTSEAAEPKEITREITRGIINEGTVPHDAK